MIKSVVWKTFRLSYVLIGIVVIVLALLTITARVAFPLLANYKGSIEQRVSDYMQSPVSVGELSVRWTGFGPVLYASDVVIEDNAQRNVTLDELHIDVDVAGSLLRGRLSISELSLVGANLVVEADEQGQFQVYGVSRSEPGATTATATDDQPLTPAPSSSLDTIQWLLNVEKIALLDTQVTLLDRRTRQNFVMHDINILAENSGGLHRLRIECVLPASLGGVLEAGVDLHGSTRQLSQLSGDLYFNADDFNLKGVMELLSLGGVSNKLGALANLNADAAVELWGTWQDGQLSSLRGPITLVNLERVDTGETLLHGVDLNLEVDNTPAQTQVIVSKPVVSLGSQSITLDQVRFSRNKSVTSNAPAEPGLTEGNSSEAVSNEAATSETLTGTNTADHALISATPWQLQASGDSVPFDLLASVLAGLLADVQPELSDTLKNSEFSGSLNDLSLSIRDIDSQPLISLSAETENLQVAGNAGLPEFGPLSASVSMVDSQGVVELSAVQIPLRWAAVSDEQLQVDRLSSTWNIDLRNSAGIALNGNVQLDDDGIKTGTDIKVAMATGTAPHLDIRSRFSASDITKIKAWLPEKVMSPAANDWIDQAILAGNASNGQLLFFGRSDEFPFTQGEGVFRASVDIDDGTLEFRPDWPDVSGINATLDVDGLTFKGVADKGLMAPFQISSSSFAIDNITAPVLELSTTAAGTLPDLTNFAVTGPLASVLEPAMSDISGTGDTQMDLALTVSLFSEPAADATGPLADGWTPLAVNGSVFLAGNDIAFEQADLVLRNATGAVGFNESGIAINKVEGDVLSHRVRLAGETVGVDSAATTTVTISGAMEANDLLAHYENSLDQFIRGSSLWNVAIKVPHSEERLASEGVQLDITSDLVGSQLLLPAPFNKLSAASVPFHLSTRFTDAQSLQQWQADYGEQLSARVNLVDDELTSVLVDLDAGTNLQTDSAVANAASADSTSEQPGSVDK